MAHYQFATIHPYYDCNGRAARLLATLTLHVDGYDLKGFYSLEEYYGRNLSRIIHSKTGLPIGKNIKLASSFWPRLIGFMFCKSPQPYDGIYFPNCKWVHNSFVRFPIDVVFVREGGEIVAIIRNFRPWHFSRIYLKARDAIEFGVGVLPPTVTVGDELKIEA